MTIAALIAADLSKTAVATEVAKGLADAPVVETPQGKKIGQAFAIASLFAREANQAALLGKSPFQQSQVEQFAAIAASSLAPASAVVEGVVFGTAKSEKFEVCLQSLKKDIAAIDKALQGKSFLVGDSLTVADVLVFCALISAYQLVLDAEFRKTTPNASQWFERVANLPEVRKRAGAVKACQIAVKPQL